MNAGEFRFVLRDLELGQREFARLTGANERTVRRWVSGELDIPQWVGTVLILFAMVLNSWREKTACAHPFDTLMEKQP